MASSSIGIPFVNNVNTLRLAIRSVFAQTTDDWELLLLDDGSTDGSLDVARSVADPRVHVLCDGKNRGLAARLNELARVSSAEILIRMDADDVMVPNRLERQLAVLRAHPEVQLVGGTSYLMNRGETVYGHHIGPHLDDDPALFLRLRGGFPFHHPAIAVRRPWLLANPYDETFRKGQEKELFCRTYGSSCFHKINEPVIFYREGGTATVATYRETRHNDRRLLQMYGRSLLGLRRSAIAYVLSYIKEAVYAVAHSVGILEFVDERIARRRADVLPDSRLTDAQALLDRIRHTAVPGWDLPGAPVRSAESGN